MQPCFLVRSPWTCTFCLEDLKFDEPSSGCVRVRVLAVDGANGLERWMGIRERCERLGVFSAGDGWKYRRPNRRVF
jgi:hypothetical protein